MGPAHGVARLGLMPRSPKPPQTGQAALIIARDTHSVAFSLHILEHRGQRSAKGGLTGSPEAMRAAFRRGYGRLALEDGKSFEISIVAHAEGSATAYFESAEDIR